MDIFFYEAFLEEVDALKRHLPPSISVGFTPMTVQESFHTEPPCPLVSIRTQSLIPISWAGRLSGILTRSTGFDHVRRFRQRSGDAVPAGYLPLYCSRSVAEHALTLWMGLLRKVPAQIRQFGRFDRDGLTGSECLGKTLLVVGVGNIGIEICRLGCALGMKVLGVDIVERHPDVSYVSIEEGIGRADVIVCAMSLGEGNRGYFNHGLLRKARSGAVFVNVARGELSPHEDLLRLVDEGLLGGVALDVYENEGELAASLRSGTPAADGRTRALMELLRRDNVILTPHNAFNTAEALERKAVQSAAQVQSFLAKGRFVWDVPE
ncbi:MAG TPA: NAD(P)-dependent oxidoreductase [Deltaproteobacteria bacterium]|nr:NAD(P)-dependent oxidoreductase [Deltaproteobacteria bacterium]HOI07383.1 NAD(P)-dependent oxidoreductase [Deltaproteobacteria bacterium]